MNNPYRVIKLLAFVTGFCIVSCTTALAQQTTFVYLQSENLQPFYVQIGDKVYSSSAIGHLVISGLADKTCNFELGFPQQTARPQRFSIPLHDRDHGYQLQKNGSRGWVLYDWQTDELIKPLKEAGNSTLLYGERKKDDAFANLMAAVVNDSAVLYTSIVKNESVTAPAVANTDAKPEEKQPIAKVEEKPVQPVETPVIEKKAEVVTVTPTPVTVDSASTIKTEAVSPDTARASQPTTDAAVTKYDPQEKRLNDKPAVAGVAKIQQQTKDGETKMVFVDSSESPAKVVTVYIQDDKNADDTLNSGIAKSEIMPEQLVKDSVKTTITTEPVKKEEPVAAAAADKPAATLTKEEIAEKIKEETWRTAPEKKANPADTATIILESRQMKKAESANEPQPLYRPKEEPKTEPAKLATRDAMVQNIKPAGTGGEETSREVIADKPEAKTEPVTTVAERETKKAEEPAKQQPKVEPETKIVDAEKRVAAEPVAAQPAVTEKPKPAEPEKKEEASNKLVMINSDCVKLATDGDIDKMRVKLMGEEDSQKRLAIANKYFKTMCLYARQIKALSELFPGDEARYKFLELAYPFAADTANFKTLHELLTEEMYITKFKKLVRLQ